MKKFINKERLTENRVYIILGLVIFIQLAFIIYGFQFKKVGYHSDELWSYGYANSYYQKDIFQDNEGNLININEWTKGQVLKDYIVVNKGEEFSYGSIYQNQMYDLSPPLHSMVLHTICSFFPERYSRWFSFSINIISFIICLIFLFKTARLLKDDVFALCCCIVYGFSLGARDTYVYLRMYGMCAALVMIIIYNFLLYLKRIKEDGKIINKNLAGICVASFAGFLTHYYMIALVGILTFFVCALLLFKKKFKVMFAYGFSLLGTLLLSLATFPTLMHMAQSQSAKVVGETKQSMNYTFEIRFKIISNFLMTKLFDIPISIYSSGLLPIVMGCLVVFFIWSVPLVFLLRKTKFIKWIARRIQFILKHLKPIFKYLWRRINWIYIIFFLTIIGQIIVVGETSNVYGMGNYEDRYIHNMYPLAVIVGMAFFYQIGVIVLKKKKYYQWCLMGITILFLGLNITNRMKYNEYYFLYPQSGVTIEEAVNDKDCIYVMNQAWLLTAATPYLMNADEFFQVFRLDYEKYEEEYRKKLEEGKVVLLIDTSFMKSAVQDISETGMMMEDEENEEINNRIQQNEQLYKNILNYFENLEPATKMKKLGTQAIFGRETESYLINP